jgi:glutathione S-transferase
MITLYSFGPAFGLPDSSPFVTKVELLLKMAKLLYRTDTTGFARAPKGKLPYIDDGGAVVADSTFIRWHLEKKYRIDFDHGLNPAQKATAWAFEKMAEEQLYWVFVHERWMIDGNFRRGPAKLLDKLLLDKLLFDKLPAAVRPLMRKSRRSARARSMRSRISSATSRSSWALSRPASTPPCFPSSAPRCVRISSRACAAPPNGARTCAATWAG